MNEDAARSAAAFSSGQLLMPDSTVESAVRAVYRVATLKGQVRWQLWALLQLTDFGDGERGAEASKAQVQSVLNTLYPDDDQIAQRNQFFERVFADFSRQRAALGNMRFSESISVMERKWLSTGGNDWNDKARSVFVCLDCVKTAAQAYLNSCEAG